MSDEPRDMRTSDPRIITPVHMARMFDETVMMFPAAQLQIAKVMAGGESRVAIRLRTCGAGTAMQFFPTTDEMRAIAREMTDQADRIEGEADAMAKQAIEKAMRND